MLPPPSTAQRIQSRGHSPRTISYGRPTLSVDPRREGVEALLYGVVVADGQPAQPHPRHPRCARLASTAPRIQSRGHSPRTIFEARGNRLRYVVCYNVRFAPTVGGGVPDAPRSRDCRAASNASVRPDQPHPRHPRRIRLRPPPHASKSRGHSPRTISFGRTQVVRPPTPGGRGNPPLRWVERHPHLTHAALNPSVTAQSAATAPLSGEPMGVRSTHVVRRPRTITFSLLER